MQLSYQEVYETACHAGFPAKVAITMTALAYRESDGIPTVHNTNSATGDDSYGLWQINLKDPNVARLMQANGLTPEMLLTPDGNAKAAHLLWGGDNKNLSIGWYIDRPQRFDSTGKPIPFTPMEIEYQTRYEAHLPAAQRAALASALG